MASFSVDDLEYVLTRTWEALTKLRQTKGDEYTGGAYSSEIAEDILNNFRRNGKSLGLEMETILFIYANKHWDAISSYVNDLQFKRDRNRSEPIEGRVDDLLNYLILFKCMLVERREEEIDNVNNRKRLQETAL